MLKKKNLIDAGILIGMSLVLTWFLEYRYFINNAGEAWNFAFERPAVFFFNAWLMLLMLIVITSITRRPWWSIGGLTVVILVASYVNINKMIMRGTPLLPEDLQLATEAAELTQFVDIWSLIRLIIAAILTLILFGFISCLYEKKLKEEKRNKAILPRIITLATTCIVFFLSTNFIIHNDGSRYERVDWLDTTLTAWNQARNYDENGFIVGFLYNLGKFKLKEPESYSEEKIQEIKNTYNEIEEQKNANKLALADQDYNIIIVLNESFFDPSIIEDYYPHTGGDITPTLHSVMQKYPSGYMYTLDYGGGTANIEFETLTGLTNYWINTVPYTNLIPKAGNILSVASLAKDNGYQTVAIHPYNGGMYKRNISLKHEGFDTFITENEMNYKDHEGDSEYINDRSAYQEVLKVINDSDKKQFVTLITMQNHTPYNEETYTEHNFKLTDFGDEERQAEIETYYQSLYYSDKYLGEFINALDASDEKTVVLFFGDHSAGLFHELNDSPDTSHAFSLSRTTPYFIYNNFDDNTISSKLPYTTPNCLSNTLLNTLGVKKTALYYMLDDVCAEQPILVQTYFGDESPEYTPLLESYELVTYDIVGGKKYWMD